MNECRKIVLCAGDVCAGCGLCERCGKTTRPICPRRRLSPTCLSAPSTPCAITSLRAIRTRALSGTTLMAGWQS